MNNKKYQTILDALLNSWSLASSSKWRPDNPAAGQCGVTALVVNDLIGGDIYKTSIEGAWHYYLMFDSIRYDFTASQFTDEIAYDDIPSNRAEAFSDTNDSQYQYLKSRVVNYLKDTWHQLV